MSLTAATRDNAPYDVQLNPDKYAAIGDLINYAAGNEIGKAEVSDILTKTYGDQGITGFLKLTGAVTNAGSSDQFEWWEEGRRHKSFPYTSGINITSDEVNIPTANLLSTNADGTTTAVPVGDFVAGDILMDLGTGVRLVYKDHGTTQGGDHTLFRLDGKNAAGTAEVNAGGTGTLIHIGNLYSQGSNQPGVFTHPEAKRRINTYGIIKDRFQVNGSQATNVGYINIGNGDYRWYMHGEAEARKRFEDRREMMLLFGELNDHSDANALAASSTGANGKFAGTEGYITALEDRGIGWAHANGVDSLADVDLILAELDANGAPSEYAMYVDRAQSLAIDDMLASQNSYGTGGTSYGAFDNNADMALQLGFKSFSRGGYTFHKHDFKLLNDPTLLGGADANFYKGVMIPLTTVADARTGVASPALEMKYKASNGYSREMEHWVTGGGIMGHTNGDNGQDVMTFHYRSEVALCTRAANQHVLITKA